MMRHARYRILQWRRIARRRGIRTALRTHERSDSVRSWIDDPSQTEILYDTIVKFGIVGDLIDEKAIIVGVSRAIVTTKVVYPETVLFIDIDRYAALCPSGLRIHSHRGDGLEQKPVSKAAAEGQLKGAAVAEIGIGRILKL